MHPKLISERSGYKAIKKSLHKYGHLMQRVNEKMQSATEELQA